MKETTRAAKKTIGITDLNSIIPVGSHLILEISQANTKLLQDLNYIKKVMTESA